MIRGLAIACLLIAEALALYVAAEWVAAAYDQHIGTIPAVLFMLTTGAAFAVIWFSEEWGLRGWQSGALIGGVAFVVLYGSLRVTFAGDVALWDFAWVGSFFDGVEATLRDNPAVIPATLLLIGAWVRGASRAANEVELEMVPRSAGLPFVVVTIIVILAAGSDRSGEVARGAAAFYAFAVLALACSQLALSGATFGDIQAGGIVSALLGVTTAVTIVSVAVFWVVFSLLGHTIGPFLADATEFILLVVLTPPAWLLEKLMRLLLSGSDFPQITETLRETISDSNANNETSEPGNAERLGRYFFRGLALLVAIGVIALAVAWYARLRGRVRSRPEQPPLAAAAGSLGEDMRGLFRRLFGRHASEGSAPYAASEAERLYFDVLARAQRAGTPRDPSETPEEYAPRLHGALRTPVTDEITVAFEHARYGAHAPDPARIADLERRLREST